MANRYGEALTAVEAAVRLEVRLWQALEAHREGGTAPERVQAAYDQWLAAFQETRVRLEDLQRAKLEIEVPGKLPTLA